MRNRFDYLRPADQAQALRAIQDGAGVPLAGGSDLVPLLKQGLLAPRALVDLGGLDILRQIKREGGRLSVGAMVPLAQLALDATVQSLFPALSHAAGRVASPQIRNVATVGGNVMQDRRCVYFNQSDAWRQSLPPCFKTGGGVCHQAPVSPVCRASYYSDVATPLVALDALAVVTDNMGEAVVPVRALCRRHSRQNGTVQRGGFLVKAFLLPIPEGPSHNLFLKRSVRQSLDFAVFNAAANVKRQNGRLSLRLVAGAVAPEPIVLEKTARLMRERLDEGGAGSESFYQAAIGELNEKAVVVKEAAIPPSAKRGGFADIYEVIQDIIRAGRLL